MAKIKKVKSWSDLPRDVRSAALAGLRDPEGSGAPADPESAVGGYKAGQEVAESLASTAIDNKETSVFCGDCLRDIPYGSSCAHIKVGTRGKRTIIG